MDKWKDFYNDLKTAIPEWTEKNQSDLLRVMANHNFVQYRNNINQEEVSVAIGQSTEDVKEALRRHTNQVTFWVLYRKYMKDKVSDYNPKSPLAVYSMQGAELKPDTGSMHMASFLEQVPPIGMCNKCGLGMPVNNVIELPRCCGEEIVLI